MRALAIGLTASLAVALIASTPAEAKEPFVGVPNANATFGLSGQPAPGFAGGGIQVGIGSGFGDHRFDRRRRGSDGNLGVWVNGGEWAHYNNRSFQSDSYNDWWHDQPWRSQPAWVRNKQGCRTYWRGGGWRC